MNLLQSFALSELRRQGAVQPRESKTVEQVCQILAGRLSGDPQAWLASDSFLLVDLPLHYASIPYPVRDPNAILAAIQAAAGTACIVVVDLNKRRIGRTGSGYEPPVVVLHGQAIVQAARLAGRETVRAWVGKLAAQKLKLIEADAATANAPASDAEGDLTRHQDQFSRRTALKDQIPKSVGRTADRGMKIENAASLHGFGSGSGPAYSTGLGTQPAAERSSMKSGKKKTLKSFAGTEMTDEALERHRGASNSELRKRFEKSGSKTRSSGLEGSGGYVGYDKATPAFKQKTRGATNSEIGPKLAAAVEDFEAAVAAGYEVLDMKNTAPPGMEDMVAGLQEKFGKKSTKPFAIAWHQYNKKGKD